MTTYPVCTAAGVIGGTLSSLFATIQVSTLTETMVLSALGAIVSFLVTLVLGWLAKKTKK